MASPPGPAGSPPYTPALNLQQQSKKRSNLSAPSQSSSKRRKQSGVSVGSAHPLRQTSFPPEGAEQFGVDVRYSRSPSIENSSVVDGSQAGGTKKRGKGRPRKGDEESVRGKANTATGSVAGGSTTGKQGDDEWGEEEAEEEGMGAELLSGGLDSASAAQEREHLDMLLSSFTPDQAMRYDASRRVKLKKETVRKITNQTLSQSVPASVVTTINSFTKVFIVELIERARDVQTEWIAAAERLPTGDMNPYWEHQRKIMGMEDREKNEPNIGANGDAKQNGHTDQGKSVKKEEILSEDSMDLVPKHEESMTTVPDSFDLLANDQSTQDQEKRWMDPVREMDRGPLTPDHLREALRRYKKDREGGSAGLQGLSLDGRENAAPRMGGRRLFK
ncbi:MAG: hypothetical protein M1820_008246 [Bogoriella megaspora]|nr:MAG: hypothetical protein M1820_008246 [Bogoriella megaspora]